MTVLMKQNNSKIPRHRRLKEGAAMLDVRKEGAAMLEVRKLAV